MNNMATGGLIAIAGVVIGAIVGTLLGASIMERPKGLA